MNDFFLTVARNIANRDLESLAFQALIYISDETISYLGKIEDFNKKKLCVSTIPSPRREIPFEKREVRPFHIGEQISVTHIEEYERKYDAMQVYTKSPKRIIAKNNVTEWFYDKEDFNLEQVINELNLFNYFTNQETGLEKMNQAFRTPSLNRIDSDSIGKVLQTRQTFCRHKCGFLYLIGKYHNLDVNIQISNFDSEGESHSFLTYVNNGTEFIIDPTLNLIESKKEFLEILRNKGKSTFYHTEYVPVSVKLEF